MTDVGPGDDAPLSPEELEDLISRASAAPLERHEVRNKEPELFDFRRPSKFSREHVRALQIVGETFARQLGTVLSTTLRAVSQVNVLSVEQVAYQEFVASTPNPSMLAILSLDPLPGAGLLALPLHLSMTAVDRLLGGQGAGTQPIRPHTDIEAALVRELLMRALAELNYAFEVLLPLQSGIVQLESNPQFAQIAAPSDMVVVTSFETRIGSEAGLMTVCLPYSSLQPTLERFTSQQLFTERGNTDRDRVGSAMSDRLEDVPIDVSVQFDAVTLTSGEIISLRRGDVLPLHQRIDSPLTVTAAGVPCLVAKAGRKGKRLACLIVEPQMEHR